MKPESSGGVGAKLRGSMRGFCTKCCGSKEGAAQEVAGPALEYQKMRGLSSAGGIRVVTHVACRDGDTSRSGSVWLEPGGEKGRGAWGDGLELCCEGSGAAPHTGGPKGFTPGDGSKVALLAEEKVGGRKLAGPLHTPSAPGCTSVAHGSALLPLLS